MSLWLFTAPISLIHAFVFLKAAQRHTQLPRVVQQRRLRRQLLQRLLDPVHPFRHRLRLVPSLLLDAPQHVLEPVQPRLQQRERKQHGLVVLVHGGRQVVFGVDVSV